MQINKALEERLWSVSFENPLDKEACDQIIDYLLTRLSDYLQQPLTHINDNWLDGDAFGADFIGTVAPFEAFHISYVGMLGMQTIGDEAIPNVSASLFLFGDHQRLSAKQSNKSLVEFIYERDVSNVGRWQSFGWNIDEFDQFEDIIESEYHHKESVEAIKHQDFLRGQTTT